MTQLLADKAILITGGSTGIGRETAFRCGQEGARILIADINDEAGLECIERLKEKGYTADFIRTDVTNTTDITRAISRCIEIYGHLDLRAQIGEAAQSRVWPLPTAAIVAGVILGVALPELDRVLDPIVPEWLGALLFAGAPDSARAMLSSIAGSLITVTSLTFSLTVVALQLASSQASPRLLRMFASDRRVHATLAMFLGTFAFAMTVLRSVRSADETIVDDTGFVPRLAVSVTFVLMLAAVVTLTLFLAHLATRLRVETMLRDVHGETTRTGSPATVAVDVAPALSVMV